MFVPLATILEIIKFTLLLLLLLLLLLWLLLLLLLLCACLTPIGGLIPQSIKLPPIVLGV